MTSARALFALLVLAVAPFSAQAQSADGDRVGTLVYFEGSVDVKVPNGSWSTAEIDQSLQSDHQIRTGPAATAEIAWKDGTKSTIGPKSTKTVGTLFDAVSDSKSSSAGVVDRLMRLFEEDKSESNDVGGIRRSVAITDNHSGPGELYWKTFGDVSFADAKASFRDGEYEAAIRKFNLFIQQHPDHARVPESQLGLALSYLKLNNPAQARDALNTLVSENPDTPVADRARSLLDRL